MYSLVKINRYLKRKGNYVMFALNGYIDDRFLYATLFSHNGVRYWFGNMKGHKGGLAKQIRRFSDDGRR